MGSSTQPHLTSNGVAFTVRVEFINRQCLITTDALHTLSALQSIDDHDKQAIDLFHAYEATISGVARRLVAAGVSGSPLVMRSATFCAPRTE